MWVLQLNEDHRANEEICDTNFRTAQKLTLGAVWLKEGQELGQELSKVFLSCLWFFVWSSCDSLITWSKEIIDGIDDHVSLLGLEWVIRVISVLKCGISHKGSCRASFESARLMLKLRQGLTLQGWLVKTPITHYIILPRGT